jgi:hypothetical protein
MNVTKAVVVKAFFFPQPPKSVFSSSFELPHDPSLVSVAMPRMDITEMASLL